MYVSYWYDLHKHWKGIRIENKFGDACVTGDAGSCQVNCEQLSPCEFSIKTYTIPDGYKCLCCTRLCSHSGYNYFTLIKEEDSAEIICNDYHYNKTNCESVGCYYWKDGTCHCTKEEEEPSICTAITDEVLCVTANCYWWNNACHDEEEIIPEIDCKDYNDNKDECLRVGCYYWKDNTCSKTPETIPENPKLPLKYLIPIIIIIIILLVIYLK